MTTTILMPPYQIIVSDEGYPGLHTIHGNDWTEADTQSSDLILLELIVEMHTLLRNVSKAIGPGACEQALPDAVTAIDQFFSKQP